MTKLQTFQDIILAGAIGDAFGYFVEFDSIEWIHAKWGDDINFSGMIHLKPNWKVSDDTQMTLFCLDAIQEDLAIPTRPLDATLHAISSNYFEWYKTQFMYKTPFMASPDSTLPVVHTDMIKFSSLYTREAPGTTCLESLASGEAGLIGNPINNSKGCGGIMRVAPISFLMLPYNHIFKLGADQAALTHGHPLGYLSAGVFALILKMSIDGIKWNTPEVKMLIRSSYNGYLGEDEFNKYLNKVFVALDNPTILTGQALNDALGQGWVGEEALGIAMYCACKFNTFSEVIEASANHNGDSDSTASLAAQLFVAMGGELDPRCHKIAISCKDVIEYEFEKMSKNIMY
jgi:ADP-ribosyl-[dinitrogen reductase] hydrolase